MRSFTPQQRYSNRVNNKIQSSRNLKKDTDQKQKMRDTGT